MTINYCGRWPSNDMVRLEQIARECSDKARYCLDPVFNLADRKAIIAYLSSREDVQEYQALIARLGWKF